MIGFLCSICALASSTQYNELFTRSSFLNSLLLVAACVFSSLRFFVTVCLGFSLWSGKGRSFWLEASLLLRRHLNLDFRQLAFLRPLLTAQNCCSISLECTQQNSVFLCKQDPFVSKVTKEEYQVFHFVMRSLISTFSEVESIFLLLRHMFPSSHQYHSC